MKTCFFIGHRNAPDSIQNQLNAEVMRLIKFCGVTDFIVGHYGNFDRMATLAVQEAKKVCPHIYAFRLLPYFPTKSSFPIPEYFDDTFYPIGMELVPRRYAIVQANRKVIDKSDYLISYVNWDGGNSATLLRHALVRQHQGMMTVINLAE